MEQIISVILESGKVAVDMALYILLPVMVVMLALMKLLDAKGVLAWVAKILAPMVKPFGLPGLGIFAAVKLLFVSFSAPMATFSLMGRNGTSLRHLAATLAMFFTMSQANVIFPMTAVGLNLPVVLMTSVIGGLCSTAFCYYLLARNPDWQIETAPEDPELATASDRKTAIQILADGGHEGMKIVIASIPMLILAICFVNTLRATDTISLLSVVLAPVLALIDLPEVTVLPIVTKFIAGGTAFMAVTVDLLNQGQLTVAELNRMAGFVMNPLDVVGVAIILSAAKQLNTVVRAAILASLFGTVVRMVIHVAMF